MSFTNISLMKKLSKLMTGPLAHHKSPSPQKLRKRYYQDFQSVAPWNNRGSLQVSDYQLMKSLAMDQINDRNRSLRYIEFEQMEFMPEIASALDIYADEMTASTSQRPCVIVKSRFPEVQEVLNVLFYDILRVENNLPGWARNMCKNGDFFLYLKLDDSLGVVNSIGLPAREIKRIEGIDPTNEDNYKYIWETTRREFEPFEIAHFRAMTDDRYYPYGVSVLEGARRIHRQLCMRGNTKVWTPTGYAELQSLKPGDEIYSYDPDTDSTVIAHVKHSMCMGEDEVFRVKTANGSVYATKDHPLLKADGSYKTVGIWDLNADQVVTITREGFVRKDLAVQSIESAGIEVVYDIETDHPTHNFIAENIVVSNCMQEDAMMSYRITRAPERLQVIIDTTGIPDDDREAYVQDFITGFRRNEVIDESTGMKNLRYKPMAIDENYFLTISDHNDKTRIETLKGGEYVGVIDDVKYLRAKLFAALKIPEEYLSLGEGKSADQGSLTQKDIRFARTVQRLQRHIVEELTRIAVIHLITLGFDNAELLDFSITLANPSVMAELQEFEHFKTKCGIIEAAGYKAKYLLGLPWLSSNILGLSADEHRQQQREVETSIRWIAKADALAEGADNEGGPAGDALGDAANAALEGAAAGGEGGGLEGGEPAEDEPDSMLLTAPARRDVKTTQRDIIGIMQQRRAADSGVTPGRASNNYTPYQKKGENADMRPLGARQRSKAARAGEQSVSATKRNIRQGLMTEDSIVNQDGDDE